MRYQPIYDIAEICARKNITDVVLCPGSRCAPLTLAFTRHPKIKARTFSDERSAGFIGLGMAQSLKRPVVIVCTSGTAVYNLAPAIAEAYFSHTPLLILTADRPAEWIAQHDGQTIYQSEVFGKHVKKYFELPQDYEHADSIWAINRTVNEAINLAIQKPCGPVHINAPFREPLYPPKGEDSIVYTQDLRVICEHHAVQELSEEQKLAIQREFPTFSNILLVAGQHEPDPELAMAVRSFGDKHGIAVVHDIISNVHGVGATIQHSDLFLGQASEKHKETLRPDLLITFGHSLVSKNLKLFLRKYPAARHWHIQHQGAVADTFKHLTDVYFTEPKSFLSYLAALQPKGSFELQKQKNYAGLWDIEERRILRLLEDSFDSGLSEFSVVKTLLDHLPDECNLHLANSMSVRYANFVGLQQRNKAVRVYANRGTSGIDGSTSTAAGHALTSTRLNILITGDLAFFYDRNAFWHNYSLDNLRILLLNNHGGLIFDILDGPSSMPEAREYFITRQALNASKLCQEFGIEHLRLDSERKMKNLLKDFLNPEPGAKVLELEGDTSTNKAVFEKLKLQIKQSYEL